MGAAMRVKSAAVALACAACAGHGGAPSSAPSPLASSGSSHGVVPSRSAGSSSHAPVVGDYTATWDPASGTLKMDARFTASAGAVFSVDRGADAFAKDVEMSADRDGEIGRAHV